MAIPLNLTLVREDDQRPRSLSDIRASMQAVPTEYVMVVGSNDVVDVVSPLSSDVHYLTTHVTTKRAYRHTRPFLAYDPVMLAQCNFMGIPIIRKDLAHLFPSTAVEPWHQLLVKAMLQGASFGPLAGEHRIVEPWPRPEQSGAYSQFRWSLDPVATMEAVPALLVTEVDQQPSFTFRTPLAQTIRVFCRDCDNSFKGSLSAQNVTVESVATYDHGRIREADSLYVAWFDGMAGLADPKLLTQLQVGLEFQNVMAVSPRVVDEYIVPLYSMSPFTLMGVVPGFNPNAWMCRTGDLAADSPTTGYTNNQAIVRKIP